MSKKNTSLIRLDGTSLMEDGSEGTHNYFKFLELGQDDYSDVVYTPDQAKRIACHLRHLSTGASAAIPLICGGPKVCPFAARCPYIREDKLAKQQDETAKPITPYGKQCHPPGELILTSNDGYKKIEDLNPSVHKVIPYEKHHNCARRKNKGLSFKKAKRFYSGQMIDISTKSGFGYKATENHICIAKFNENAVGKFCVYLMRKGDFWRVGKSQILGRYAKDNRYGHKTFLGFTTRGTSEKADDMWVLGIYNTTAEAFLAEDYFSCTFQTSKALFQETSENISKRKWNGLYAWATQEQLDNHHKRFKKPPCFYKDKLSELGLSIDYPIWTLNKNKGKTKPEDTKIKARYGMYIRACNIIPEIMDVPCYSEEFKHGLQSARWEKVQISKSKYSGYVYSLEVEKYHTYFANGIATHNCLVEVQLLNEWTKLFIYEYEINEKNFTEFNLVRELAEIELMLWRLNNNLSKPEHAELLQETVVGVDREGNPLTRTEVSSLYEVKERLQNRKTKIIKLMVGDREGKKKMQALLREKTNDDSSTVSANLRTEINSAMAKIKALDIEVKYREGKIVDGDIINSDDKPVILTPADLINQEE